jgi:hypothetical protein
MGAVAVGKELERTRIAAMKPLEQAAAALALGRRLGRLREAQARA